VPGGAAGFGDGFGQGGRYEMTTLIYYWSSSEQLAGFRSK
jgi:hypothetical protein